MSIRKTDEELAADLLRSQELQEAARQRRHAPQPNYRLVSPWLPNEPSMKTGDPYPPAREGESGDR